MAEEWYFPTALGRLFRQHPSLYRQKCYEIPKIYFYQHLESRCYTPDHKRESWVVLPYATNDAPLILILLQMCTFVGSLVSCVPTTFCYFFATVVPSVLFSYLRFLYCTLCCTVPYHAGRHPGYRVGKFLEGSTTITNGFTHAISTGNWVLKRFKVDRQGVTQVGGSVLRRVLAFPLPGGSSSSPCRVCFYFLSFVSQVGFVLPCFCCDHRRRGDVIVVGESERR